MSTQIVSTPESPHKKTKAWGPFWQGVVRFQKSKVNPRIAARNALGVALPLIAGVALGEIGGGLAMATGAMNVSYSDSPDPYIQRARKMLASSVLVGLAVFAGAISGHNHIAAVIVATVWAFAAGMAVSISTNASDIGSVSLFVLLVYAAVPQPLERAIYGGLLAFGGGLVQMGLALAFWPLHRHVPERMALSNLFRELSGTALRPVEASEAPAASTQSTLAQHALSDLDRDGSAEGERYHLLLSQAERVRLTLLMLGRLRVRMEREAPGRTDLSIPERYFEICSEILAAIGKSLAAGRPAAIVPERLQELQDVTDRLRQDVSGISPEAEATRREQRFQMDALAGQLRAAVDLAAYSTPAGLAAFERREAGKPRRLRLGGTIATLRANLTLRSAACRHAVRLAVCVGGADALARTVGLARAYWLPMTTAIVLKPDFGSTYSRGVLRLVGTFAGLIVATVLFHVLPSSHLTEVALATILMFVVRAYGPANYGILVTGVTGLVVILIAMTGVAPQPVMAARAVNTAAGGAIALFAYWIWPTWERTQISEALARTLDSYRLYFRSVRDAYVKGDDAPSAPEVDRQRTAARLARSNLEASVERLRAEPGSSAADIAALTSILASSHRVVHAIMALEAGRATSHPAPPREAFLRFANDVEFTLYYLASALRGSPLLSEHLPDLREDHHALVHTGSSANERYALVNVETDRMTNGLNTLTEELLRWVQSGRNRA